MRSENPQGRRWVAEVVAGLLLVSVLAGLAPLLAEERLVLESGGWRLVGDLLVPTAASAVPAALLLHRAAGTRREYAGFAAALAERGIASLRVDLRAHGESDNLGRFEEPFAENRHLLNGTHEDVDTVLRWLAGHPGVERGRLAVVGASYSGEAIGEALRAGGRKAQAYVLLSPGSFSKESTTMIDGSGAAWLFVRSTEEDEVSRPFIDAVFEALASEAQSAEILVVPGRGHATRIFDEHPEFVEEVADWLAARLD